MYKIFLTNKLFKINIQKYFAIQKLIPIFASEIKKTNSMRSLIELPLMPFLFIPMLFVKLVEGQRLKDKNALDLDTIILNQKYIQP